MKRLTHPAIRIASWLALLLAMFAIGSRLPHSLSALAEENGQTADGDSVPPAGEDAQNGQQRQSVGWLILDSAGSGIIFYVILAIFSIVALSVTLERLVNLTRGKTIPPPFVEQLRGIVEANDGSRENFERLCQSFKAPVANILHAGTLRSGRPLPEVEKAMEDAAIREMAAMRGRIRPLNVVGSVAPLVGLLGTVVGMIFAFRVSSQAGLGKAELLAEGIYLALMTTAAGLTIAIPCLLLVAWFNARVERYMREIDVCLLETMPSFARMES